MRSSLTWRSAGSGLAEAGMSAPTSFTLSGSGRGCSSANSPLTRCISSSLRASVEVMSRLCFFLQCLNAASEDATISRALSSKAAPRPVRQEETRRLRAACIIVASRRILHASMQKGCSTEIAG